MINTASNLSITDNVAIRALINVRESMKTMDEGTDSMRKISYFSSIVAWKHALLQGICRFQQVKFKTF